MKRLITFFVRCTLILALLMDFYTTQVQIDIIQQNTNQAPLPDPHISQQA